MARKTAEVLFNRTVKKIHEQCAVINRSPLIKVVLAAVLAAGVLVGMTGSASAEITVVLDVGGAGSPDLLQEIAETLIDVVSINPDLELSDHRDMTVQDAMDMLAYDAPSPEFLVDLTLTLEADRILFVQVVETDTGLGAEVMYYDAVLAETLLNVTFPVNTEEERAQMTHQLHADIGNQAIVELVAERPGIQVTVDDSPLGEAPLVSYGLVPGPHTVSATCPECEVLTRQITLVPGQYTRMDITPSLLSAYVEPPEPGGGRSIVLPAVTLGTGVAMVGAGVAFGLMTNSTQDDFDASTDIVEAEDLADQGETYATLANVFLFGGSAVAVAGIVLFFVGGGDDSGEEEQARSRTERPRASGWVAGDSGGLLVDWNF